MRTSTERDRAWLKPHSLSGRAGARTLLPAGCSLHSSASAWGCLGDHRDFFRDPSLQSPGAQLYHRWNPLKGRAEKKRFSDSEARRGRCLCDGGRGKSYVLFCPFPFSTKIVSGWEAGSGGITRETEDGGGGQAQPQERLTPSAYP